MRLFLAGTNCDEPAVRKHPPEYVLESFYYFKPWQAEELPRWKMFLLDSGAFTFMHSQEAAAKPVNWDAYLSRYIAFINQHRIQHFFELDVDMITGYDAVKRMRARLEAETGRQSIPVWHRSRGLDEFKQLCKDYPYIGIGGFAVYEWGYNELKVKLQEIGFSILQEIGLVAGAKELDALYAEQPEPLSAFYRRMRAYLPSVWLTAIMAIPFPQQAKELLFIVEKPKEA